jgi:hypothetical protein
MDILQEVRNKITDKEPRTKIGGFIFVIFQEIYKNDLQFHQKIEELLDTIDINEFDTHMLFFFLTAANWRRDQITNYYKFLSKIKKKVINEGKYTTKKELKELFQGLE